MAPKKKLPQPESSGNQLHTVTGGNTDTTGNNEPAGESAPSNDGATSESKGRGGRGGRGRRGRPRGSGRGGNTRGAQNDNEATPETRNSGKNTVAGIEYAYDVDYATLIQAVRKPQIKQLRLVVPKGSTFYDNDRAMASLAGCKDTAELHSTFKEGDEFAPTLQAFKVQHEQGFGSGSTSQILRKNIMEFIMNKSCNINQDDLDRGLVEDTFGTKTVDKNKFPSTTSDRAHATYAVVMYKYMDLHRHMLVDTARCSEEKKKPWLGQIHIEDWSRAYWIVKTGQRFLDRKDKATNKHTNNKPALPCYFLTKEDQNGTSEAMAGLNKLEFASVDNSLSAADEIAESIHNPTTIDWDRMSEAEQKVQYEGAVNWVKYGDRLDATSLATDGTTMPLWDDEIRERVMLRWAKTVHVLYPPPDSKVGQPRAKNSTELPYGPSDQRWDAELVTLAQTLQNQAETERSTLENPGHNPFTDPPEDYTGLAKTDFHNFQRNFNANRQPTLPFNRACELLHVLPDGTDPTTTGKNGEPLQLLASQVHGAVFIASNILGPARTLVEADGTGQGKTITGLEGLQLIYRNTKEAFVKMGQWEKGINGDWKAAAIATFNGLTPQPGEIDATDRTTPLSGPEDIPTCTLRGRGPKELNMCNLAARPPYKPTLVAGPISTTSVWKLDSAAFPNINYYSWYGSRSSASHAEKQRIITTDGLNELIDSLDPYNPQTMLTVIMTTFGTLWRRDLFMWTTDNDGNRIKVPVVRRINLPKTSNLLDEDNAEDEEPEFDRSILDTCDAHHAKKFGLVMIDEAHKVKNFNTLSATVFYHLQPQYLVMITATPTMTKLSDFTGLMQQAIRVARVNGWDPLGMKNKGHTNTVKEYGDARAELDQLKEPNSVEWAKYGWLMCPDSFREVVGTGFGDDGQLDVEGAGRAMPAVWRIFKIRRVKGDKINGPGDQEEIVGSTIPAHRITHTEVRPNVNQLNEFLGNHHILLAQAGGGGGLDEFGESVGHRNNDVHRLMMMASSIIPIGRLHNRGQLLVKDIKQQSSETDAYKFLFKNLKKNPASIHHADRTTAIGEWCAESPKYGFLVGHLYRKVYQEVVKLLIFCHWPLTQFNLETFIGLCGIPFLIIKSSHTPSQREAIQARFDNPYDAARVLITTYSVGGQSTNFQHGCKDILMFEPFTTPNDGMQALGRCVRIGQKFQVEVIVLVQDFSYDQYIQSTNARRHLAELMGNVELSLAFPRFAQAQKVHQEQSISSEDAQLQKIYELLYDLHRAFWGQRSYRHQEEWRDRFNVFAKNKLDGEEAYPIPWIQRKAERDQAERTLKIQQMKTPIPSSILTPVADRVTRQRPSVLDTPSKPPVKRKHGSLAGIPEEPMKKHQKKTKNDSGSASSSGDNEEDAYLASEQYMAGMVYSDDEGDPVGPGEVKSIMDKLKRGDKGEGGSSVLAKSSTEAQDQHNRGIEIRDSQEESLATSSQAKDTPEKPQLLGSKEGAKGTIAPKKKDESDNRDNEIPDSQEESLATPPKTKDTPEKPQLLGSKEGAEGTITPREEDESDMAGIENTSVATGVVGDPQGTGADGGTTSTKDKGDPMEGVTFSETNLVANAEGTRTGAEIAKTQEDTTRMEGETAGGTDVKAQIPGITTTSDNPKEQGEIRAAKEGGDTAKGTGDDTKSDPSGTAIGTDIKAATTNLPLGTSVGKSMANTAATTVVTPQAKTQEYSNAMTVVQAKEEITRRGLKIPPKAKKDALVRVLVDDDIKNGIAIPGPTGSGFGNLITSGKAGLEPSTILGGPWLDENDKDPVTIDETRSAVPPTPAQIATAEADAAKAIAEQEKIKKEPQDEEMEG